MSPCRAPVLPLAALLAVMLASSAASAQAVWRCGADGRSYTQQPCAEGQPLLAADARPAADLQAAQALAARERRLADALLRERLAREARPLAAAGIAPALRPTEKPKAQKAKKPSKPQPPAADGTFRAAAPATPRIPG